MWNFFHWLTLIKYRHDYSRIISLAIKKLKVINFLLTSARNCPKYAHIFVCMETIGRNLVMKPWKIISFVARWLLSCLLILKKRCYHVLLFFQSVLKTRNFAGSNWKKETKNGNCKKMFLSHSLLPTVYNVL